MNSRIFASMPGRYGLLKKADLAQPRARRLADAYVAAKDELTESQRAALEAMEAEIDMLAEDEINGE